MNPILLLKQITIENANTIAGLTYGFPAITHFLGFTHALSRLITREFSEVELTGCAVIVHSHQVKAQQPKGWGDNVFALNRNPLTKDGKTAPFIEEGKMHLRVSLIIETQGYISQSIADDLEIFIEQKLPKLRLAGGTITGWQNTEFYDYPTDLKSIRKLMFPLLPGFILMDRSPALQQHLQTLQSQNPNAQLLDAWLDFATLKYKATPKLEDGEPLSADTKADWHYVPKPAPGYLVPITTGYKGISPLYQPGQVANARDQQTPFQFVEAIYGLGEWQSPHKITDIEHIFWRYQTQGDWYLCQQTPSKNTTPTDTELTV